MRIMPFSGWAIGWPRRGYLYPQIETIRYTRRDAIEACVDIERNKLRNMGKPREDTAVVWKRMKAERNLIPLKVRLEAHNG